MREGTDRICSTQSATGLRHKNGRICTEFGKKLVKKKKKLQVIFCVCPWLGGSLGGCF